MTHINKIVQDEILGIRSGLTCQGGSGKDEIYWSPSWAPLKFIRMPGWLFSCGISNWILKWLYIIHILVLPFESIALLFFIFTSILSYNFFLASLGFHSLCMLVTHLFFLSETEMLSPKSFYFFKTLFI